MSMQNRLVQVILPVKMKRSLLVLLFTLTALYLSAQVISLPGFDTERIIGADRGELASFEEEGWSSREDSICAG